MNKLAILLMVAGCGTTREGLVVEPADTGPAQSQGMSGKLPADQPLAGSNPAQAIPGSIHPYLAEAAAYRALDYRLEWEPAPEDSVHDRYRVLFVRPADGARIGPLRFVERVYQMNWTPIPPGVWVAVMLRFDRDGVFKDLRTTVFEVKND